LRIANRTQPVLASRSSVEHRVAAAGFGDDLPYFDRSTAPWVRVRQGGVGWLSRSIQIDVDAEQRNRFVLDPLPDDVNFVHETAAGNQVA